MKRALRYIGIFAVAMFLLSIVTTIAYRWINPPITPLMISQAFNGAGIKKEWVPLDQISPNLVCASIASEDNNFLGHRGFDIGAIYDAIDEHNRGKRQRGASTISQQTAKNVFLWSGKSWIRKGFEVYFTFLIEHLWGKERIMEIYLNVIEMGMGIYGAEAAAQHYFGRSAAKLTKRQAALLVSAYPAPRHRDPAHPTAFLNKRAAQIQRLMPLMGTIAFDDECIEAARERYDKYVEKRKATRNRNKNKK
ncbi:MAG: monofunctional biosynthetic peptidoglycan transglycosylase [Rikenellaceae bacterium]|nr:monofunctional biosynthetic peptidoglycan transglycosylase [Rikenellaceae bacterium]